MMLFTIKSGNIRAFTNYLRGGIDRVVNLEITISENLHRLLKDR